MKEKRNMERSFSIELDSKNDLKTVTMTNGSSDGVLVEGTIGDLVQAEFIEDVILEVIGKKGVLRVNLEPKELKKRISNGGEKLK
jgi:hypothetical protein